MCCFKKKRKEHREREKKQESEKKKKNDTLNKKRVMSRFLCREFFFLEQEFGKIFTYLSVYPVSENVTVRIQQRRARRVVSLTQNRLYAFISIIYNTLLREREREDL